MTAIVTLDALPLDERSRSTPRFRLPKGTRSRLGVTRGHRGAKCRALRHVV
jgi:hypothetical protein